jgi:YbbR domain-containing protein
MLPVDILDEDNQVVPYVQSDPSEVSVTPAVAAAATKKRLLISPNWSGQPAFGYKVVSYEIRPSQVELRGDSATISRMSMLDTESISIAGLSADATLRVKLKLPAGTKTTEPSEVTVIVKVAKRPGAGMSGP